ncbi:MAG: hypothetical protein Q9184_001876 [Pyrenodesmia sp. 2 TL-2023]
MAVVHLLEALAALVLCIGMMYMVKKTILSPLKDIRGPFLAKLTNIYQLVIYYRKQQVSVLRRLHRADQVIRIGPNHVSLSDPNLIKTIYDMRGNYTKAYKSNRYAAADSISPDGRNIPVQFSTLDEQQRNTYWRPVAKYFSLTNILNFEPQIDSVIRMFHQQLEERFCVGENKGAVCDMYTWLNFAAWEVINVVNFSQMLGFLENGEDVEGALAESVFAGDAFTFLGHAPWIERTVRYLLGKPIFNGALQFSKKSIAERRTLSEGQIHSPPDFLHNFFEAHQADSKGFSENILMCQLLSNVAAGGDTAGGTMAGTVYNTLNHPRVLKRLQQELDSAIQETPVSWKVVSTLPYFDAVIQESIRFHPGTSFTLERVVPREGLRLPDDRFLEPGTIVGMHPWIINRNQSIFGADADSFVPERWLQNDHESAEDFANRLSGMEKSILSFGAGRRGCIGKNLAMLEMKKILGTLFANFEIERVEGREPKVVHSIFVRMEGFNVRMKVRAKGIVA